jgi:AraC-like DNA-binding protein
VTVFDSAAFAGSQGFDAYRALYQGGSDVTRSGPAFLARLEAQRLGRLVMFDRQLNDVTHARGPDRVRADGFEHFTLQLVLEGRLLVETPEHRVIVGPDQMILFDLTRPQETRAENAHYLTFSVPRDMIEAATLRSFALHGAVLSARAGLLADLMISLVTRRVAEGDGLTAAAMTMFEHALAAALGADAPVSGSKDNLQRARLVIEQSLSSRGLTPDTIAQATSLSRSALYELFRPWGGVSRYVQTRRAARLRSLLGRSENRARSIAALSYEAGFAAESHASRVYKGEYGETPGQRRQHLLTPAHRLIDDTSGFDAWIRAANR